VLNIVYEPKNFDSLLGTKGLSDQLLKNHFMLYQGYVTNTNKIADALNAVLKEGKTGTPEYAELKRRFGWEYENWEKDFKAMGAMRGIGWVMLYYDPWADRLFNAWINEHDGFHLCGATPLLIMDVFEHACMVDYGLKRADYIEAFFKAIDWRVEDWVDKSWNLQDQSIHRCSQ